jgi:Trk-type K+ transport system membrane component
MPLMFLGSLGGPVLLELLKRMTRRNDVGLESVSKDTWGTIGGSLAVLLVGATALFVLESTRDYQQRYPREKTPGRLMVSSNSTAHVPATAPAHSTGGFATTQPVERAPIEFSAATSQRAKSERLTSMTVGNRIRAALFQAEAARTGGAKSARIDETSLSPVSHFLLMGLMLIGGGVGGAAGGLRILVVWILVAAALNAGRPIKRDPRKALEGDTPRAIAMAAGLATAMFVLIGVVATVLLYRETGTFLACVFEAVSACCNAGLSLGMTSELSLPGRVMLIFAMILGRVIPLAILMRAIIPSPAVLPRPLLAPEPRPPDDDDAPIPLE